MQKTSLKQEENVLVLMRLGADPSWKWFGLESTFCFFLSPPGHRCLGGYTFVHVFTTSKQSQTKTPGWDGWGSGCLDSFKGWLLPQC